MLCQVPLPALSHLSTGETINSPPLWEENTEQRAEQVNLPKTHSSEQNFEPQMPLCSHFRDWSRLFCLFPLKLCFSLSYREWIINYNRTLCVSKVPELQGSTGVWGGGGAVPGRGAIIWEITHAVPPAKRDWRLSWGLREEEQWFRMKPSPKGPVWNLY